MDLIAEVRVGECNFCGACCSGGDPFLGTLGEPQVEGACALLRAEPDGTFRCAEWGDPASYWANGCNVWPTIPAHVEAYPRCGYRWIPVDGGALPSQ